MTCIVTQSLSSIKTAGIMIRGQPILAAIFFSTWQQNLPHGRDVIADHQIPPKPLNSLQADSGRTGKTGKCES